MAGTASQGTVRMRCYSVKNAKNIYQSEQIEKMLLLVQQKKHLAAGQRALRYLIRSSGTDCGYLATLLWNQLIYAFPYRNTVL